MNTAAVRLVAWREIVTRIRSKAFVLTNVASLVLIVGGLVAYNAFGGDEDDTTTRIAVSSDADPLTAALETIAAERGLSVGIFPAGTDDVDRLVTDGDADIAITKQNTGYTATTTDGLDESQTELVNAAIGRQNTIDYLQQQNVDPDRYLDQLATATLTQDVLDPADPAEGQRFAVAFFGLFILFMGIIQFASAVATGVIEEKSSRVVELLLSTMRPIDLLVGKIIGIGVVGVLQTLIIGGGALAATIAGGILSIENTAVWVFASTMGWFVLGYTFCATIYAATGALVSRLEDAAAATTPINIVLMASFYFAVFSSTSSGSRLTDVLSFVPPLSAFLMPVRVAHGTVGAPAFVVSALVTVVAIAIVAVLAARMYERAILHTGAKLPWREAFSAALRST